ncbi:hypothetical protein BK026_06380 [Alteromonas sp. V450]|uniref:hypothetical protein n=1 Tax=Alteromonas sp. V450 TaxID=1912139 RepID=UPI0008FF74BD|nr:hypothetical protein [Alteromonas sp. V450]OJF68443.1 hypothetical protein BK026_06380 [Alteromonas sp. V450]
MMSNAQALMLCLLFALLAYDSPKVCAQVNFDNGANATAVHKELLICNTADPNNSALCTQYSEERLKERATTILFQQSCGAGEMGIACSDDRAVSEVRYLVVDAQNAHGEYFSISKDGFGTSLISNRISIGTTERSILDSLLTLEELFEQLPNEFRFSISDDGVVTNGFSEVIQTEKYMPTKSNNIEIGSAQKINSSSTPGGRFKEACPSAVAFVVSSQCNAELVTFLDGMNEKSSSSFLRKLTDALDGTSIQLTVGGFALARAISNEFPISFTWPDGSYLLLDLDLGEALGIAPDYTKSRGARNKDGKKPLLSVAANDLQAGSALPIAGSEVQSYLRGLSQNCRSFSNIIGYRNFYIITKVTYPDGKTTITVTPDGSEAIHGAPTVSCTTQ